MPYSLCHFFDGGVRRVFRNSFGKRHAGGLKGLGNRSPGVSAGTACLMLGESDYSTEFLFPHYEIAGR